MSNKNPFELRADLLSMAKDYMDTQYHMNMDFARRAFDAAVEAGKATQEQWKTFAPPAYTIDEMKKVAEQLYSFVAPARK